MRTTAFLTVAIAALLLNFSDARTLNHKKRAGGSDLVGGLLGSAAGPTGPLSSVTGLTNGIVAPGGAQQAQEKRKRRKRGLIDPKALEKLLNGKNGKFGLLLGGILGKPLESRAGGRSSQSGSSMPPPAPVDGRSPQSGPSKPSSPPSSGGILGKRYTGFPETAETKGKTILVIDADVLNENDADSRKDHN